MALRQIRVYGDDLLKKKARPVKDFDESLFNLLDDMWDTLREFDGLGLAAPQIGMLRRIIVIELEEDNYELINPEIVEATGLDTKNEACLSVPNKQGDVERPTFVRIAAVDRHNNPYELETDDEMLATAICHEIDHLDGVLFLDKAKKIQDRPPDEDPKKAKRERERERARQRKKRGKKPRTKIIPGKRAVGN